MLFCIFSLIFSSKYISAPSPKLWSNTIIAFLHFLDNVFKIISLLYILLYRFKNKNYP